MPTKHPHRIYRGIAKEHGGTDVRILVMDSGAGPTERDRANVLYPLAPKEPYWWGYGGGSPSRAATAILDDALPDALPALKVTNMPHGMHSDLVVAFTQDFLAYLALYS